MDAQQMLRSLDDERERGLRAVSEAATMTELEAALVSVLGRKAPFSEVQRAVGSLAPDERKSVGTVVNETRAALQHAADARRTYNGRERTLFEA